MFPTYRRLACLLIALPANGMVVLRAIGAVGEATTLLGAITGATTGIPGAAIPPGGPKPVHK